MEILAVFPPLFASIVAGFFGLLGLVVGFFLGKATAQP